MHSKGILGGTEEAGRHIGYLTKYLTKSLGEIVEPYTDRQRAHHDRLHAELAGTPCSPRCTVWLLYGIQPHGVTSKTQPGRCKGRAHRRTTLGMPGRRVLVSRKWSGKTLADHRADRKEFVLEALAAVGIRKAEPDPARLVWQKVAPGGPNLPSRAHLLMHFYRAVDGRTRSPPGRGRFDGPALADITTATGAAVRADLGAGDDVAP